MLKTLLCSVMMLCCGISSQAQFLTISDVSSTGVDGVSLVLGDPNLPGLHPGIRLFAPQPPADSIGSILFAPVQGQPPLRLSNLLSGGGGIDIEIVSLNLTSHSPGISLRLNDSTDNIFGGSQIFRLNDSLPRIRLSNVGPNGTRGIEIEIVELDLVSAGPSIRLINDPLLPFPHHIELVPDDTLPFFVLESRSGTSTSLTMDGVPFLPFSRPSITFAYDFILSDSFPVIRLEPDPSNPFLRVSNFGLSGSDGILFDTPRDLFFRSQDSVFHSSLRLNRLGTATIDADKGVLTVSNIGSSGDDGVAIDLGNTQQDSIFRFIYDANDNVVRFVNPSRYIYETDLGLTTTYAYDGLDRRTIRLEHDDNNPGNDLTVEYEYDTRRRDIRGADTTNHTSSSGLESRYVYDALDRVVTEYNKPADPDTFRRVYLFDDNSYRLFNTDSVTFSSSGTLCYGRRFFEPGKSVSVDVLNKANSRRISTVYDLNTRVVRVTGADTYGQTGSGDLEVYDRLTYAPNRILRVWRDINTNDSTTVLIDPNAHTRDYGDVNSYIYRTGAFSYRTQLSGSAATHTYDNGSQTMRRVYDPGTHSISCRDVSSYTYATSNLSCRSGLTSTRYSRLYTDTSAARSMLCEYIPSIGTMSCSSYDSTARTSTANMRCTSSFDNGAGRTFTRSISDQNTLNTMSVTYAPNARAIAMSNVDARVYFSSPALALSTRRLYVAGGYEELHVQNTDSVLLQISPSTHNVVLSDPAGNNVDLSVSGEISAGSVASNGSVTASSATVNGLLDVQEVVVAGNLVVLGTKMFRIDHPLDPENKYLYHNCIESPDMMNIYNGNIVTNDDGIAHVTLPDYFETLNVDFRYQLTVVGQFAQAIIKEKVNDNVFVIQTDKPGVEVSWQVTGIRNDPAARAMFKGVEVEKPEGVRGELLYH